MPIDAVLFDMDGTLVRSEYDWPAIRAELGVEGASLIDALNALPEPQRSAAWARLNEIEREATEAATLVAGTVEILELLRRSGVKTALVTNNSDRNTAAILERFNLQFDQVLTRDSGLYKPSGAPFTEAMVRLGVDPSRVLAVGDSKYDLRAARESGCGLVAVVNGGYERHRMSADLAFADLFGLLQFLEIETEN
ncbi:MAG: HAD family hydrolase [Thermoanaerobaculales bacterium]|nr:HAD family hydrolase [Thermoanaerobaculales bacterium]